MSTTIHTEGEANTSAARQDWSSKETDAAANGLLSRDADVFLHQSLSSPCVSTIAKAEIDGLRSGRIEASGLKMLLGAVSWISTAIRFTISVTAIPV